MKKKKQSPYIRRVIRLSILICFCSFLFWGYWCITVKRNYVPGSICHYKESTEDIDLRPLWASLNGQEYNPEPPKEWEEPCREPTPKDYVLISTTFALLALPFAFAKTEDKEPQK